MGRYEEIRDELCRALNLYEIYNAFRAYSDKNEDAV
jgi:hypothetical protein